MRRFFGRAAVVLAALGMAGSAAALAGEDPLTAGDWGSPDATRLATLTTGTGGDIAFEGDLAIVGHGFATGRIEPDAGFDVVDIAEPARPRVIGRYRCAGTGQDVSVYRDLVILSADAQAAGGPCGTETAPPVNTADSFSGLVVVSIADPANPRPLAYVRKAGLSPGSHTHTLLPDLEHRDARGQRAPRLLVFLNAPLGGQQVAEVPLRRPADARILGQITTAPSPGCHDLTVRIAGADVLGACAGVSETQLWRISRTDPTRPERLATVRNPAFTNQHTTAFSGDGETLVIGDETAAVGTTACNAGTARLDGRLWFYDITDRRAPALRGSFMATQRLAEGHCTAHQFNVVPFDDGRDVLVAAWGGAGTTVVDFGDPAAPREIGFYVPRPTGVKDLMAFASYWYRGHVYVNHAAFRTPHPRGLDVLSFGDPALAGAVRLKRLNAQTQDGW